MNPFIRRVVSPGRFPQSVGQEMPDPVTKGRPKRPVDPASREKALGRTASQRLNPKS